jgi:hypothetical protein
LNSVTTQYQRVLELAARTHRRSRNRAAVRGDEIHHAERQRLDARVRCQRLYLAQRAMGFHQRVQRDRLRHAGVAFGRLDGGDGALQIGQPARLRDHQVGQPCACALDHL